MTNGQKINSRDLFIYSSSQTKINKKKNYTYTFIYVYVYTIYTVLYEYKYSQGATIDGEWDMVNIFECD